MLSFYLLYLIKFHKSPNQLNLELNCSIFIQIIYLRRINNFKIPTGSQYLIGMISVALVN